MLIGVLGGFGSGKTLLMAIWGYRLSSFEDLDVYSNFRIEHEKSNFITPPDLFDINPMKNKAFVLLDEVYAWLDSRYSVSKVNRALSSVILQSRKRNMDICYSAQLGGSVDLRMRDNTDLVVYCQDIGLPPKPKGFAYILEYHQGFRVLLRSLYLPYGEAKKWFGIYDTREIVQPIGIEKLKETIKQSS